jgi:hypothetical protein
MINYEHYPSGIMSDILIFPLTVLIVWPEILEKVNLIGEAVIYSWYTVFPSAITNTG